MRQCGGHSSVNCHSNQQSTDVHRTNHLPTNHLLASPSYIPSSPHPSITLTNLTTLIIPILKTTQRNNPRIPILVQTHTYPLRHCYPIQPTNNLLHKRRIPFNSTRLVSQCRTPTHTTRPTHTHLRRHHTPQHLTYHLSPMTHLIPTHPYINPPHLR